MSKLLKKKLPHLLVLQNSCEKVRRAILQNCDDNLVKVLSNCTLNAIQNPAIKLRPSCIRKLEPYKNIIRRFACRKTSIKDKKAILHRRQTGGWILPIISGLISTVLPKIIEKFTAPKDS